MIELDRIVKLRRQFTLGVLLVNLGGFVYGLVTNNALLAMFCAVMQYVSFYTCLHFEQRYDAKKRGVVITNPTLPSILTKKKETKEKSYDSKNHCASCGDPLTIKEIKEGVTLCPNCELEESGTGMIINQEE